MELSTVGAVNCLSCQLPELSTVNSTTHRAMCTTMCRKASMSCGGNQTRIDCQLNTGET